MQYVSLDSVVDEAMLVVGKDNENELLKNIARQWVWRAMQDFPVTEDEIKVCRLYPKNLIMKKPDDMRWHLELAMFDSAGNFIPSVYHAGKKRIYPDMRVYPYSANNSTEDTVIYNIPVDYSSDQFSFILGSNGTDVAYADVRYYAYPIDSQGLPMIDENAVQTLIYYIRFNASMRNNENQSQIQLNREMYQVEADRYRAKKKAATLNNDERKKIAAIRNRMLPNFNRSQF